MSEHTAYPIPPLPPAERICDDDLIARADAWMTNLPDPQNVWVFGTASLIWNPCFAYVERRRALVRGWHRSLCLYSVHYRGTVEQPGLVMGLAQGGQCEGCAFRLDPDQLQEAARGLWLREMGHSSYEMITVTGETDQGTIPCFSFAPKPGHPQCAVGLPTETIEAVVRVASGCRGSNLDYVLTTVAHLDQMGIHDPDFHALAARLTEKEQ